MMKKRTKRGVRWFAGWILLFALLPILTSCKGGGAGNLPKFMEKDRSFTTEIRGEIGQIPFSAKVELAVNQTNSGGKEPILKIEYLTPDSLRGICAEWGERENVTVNLGELTEELARDEAGLLRPAELLFKSGEYASVCREGDSYRFTFADSVTLILSAEGIPQKVMSDDCKFEVVWWEYER